LKIETLRIISGGQTGADRAALLAREVVVGGIDTDRLEDLAVFRQAVPLEPSFGKLAPVFVAGAVVEHPAPAGIFPRGGCLNNLELKRTKTQDDLLTQAKDFREDYTLRYMLDVETRGSASLLNVQKFTDSFSYKLKVSTGTVGEAKEVNIDLVETFNWLVGLPPYCSCGW
jgi:hypothetical protein